MNQNPKTPEQKAAATGKKTKQKTQTKQSKKVIPKPQLPAYVVQLESVHFYEQYDNQGNFISSQRAKFTDGNNKVLTVFAKALIENNQALIKNFRLTAKTLAALRHPHIVNLVALVDDNKRPLIALLEYFPGKTLDDHFRHNQAALSWNVRLRIAIECASALDYLARNKVVYAQMASRNVILSQNDFTSKLCDFALISPTNENNIRWLAPEVLKRGHFTIQSDIWAYGIFLMELFLDGMKPYPELLEMDVVAKLTDGSLHRMDVPSFLPEKLQYNIKRCWEETPDKRPGVHVIMKEISTLIIPPLPKNFCI